MAHSNLSLQNVAYLAVVGTSSTPTADATFIRGGYGLGQVYWPGTPQEVTGAQILAMFRDFERGTKADNTWSLIRAYFPFAGDQAGQMRLNLRSATDGLFVQNNANDANPEATRFGYRDVGGDANGYLDTQLVPYGTLSDNSNGLGVYITQDYVTNGVQVDIGSNAGSTLFDLLTVGSTRYGEHSGGATVNGSDPSGLGFRYLTRVAANDIQLYREATSIGSSTTASSGYPTIPTGIGNRAGQPIYGSLRTYGAGLITDGATPAQVALLRNRVYNSQVTLGRA